MILSKKQLLLSIRTGKIVMEFFFKHSEGEIVSKMSQND